VSFIDGIFNGISHAVKGALGIDDAPKHDDAKPAKRAATARSTRTGFEQPDSGSEAEPAREASSPSTLDSVLRRHVERTTTPDAGDPQQGYGTADPDGTAAGYGSATGTAEVPGTYEAPATTGAPAAQARVYDAATNAQLGTADTLGGDGDAAAAARNVQHGLDWLSQTFGRNGVDGAGTGVDVMVDDRTLDEQGEERFKGNGGYYVMPDAAGVQREAIHFGTGTSYDGAAGLVDQAAMQHADDLTIHELMHGVIRSETGQLGGDADEAGATNEAMADVLAASATRDWRLGEGMFTDASAYRAMRDIANPDDPTAIHGLWTSMDEVRSNAKDGEIEEHWASGVISTAAQRVQSRIGGEEGWQVVEHVFYDAIDGHRLGDMSFQSVANGLRASAAADYGAGSSQALIVDEELRRAGL
jgi:hypothetical protein